MDRCDDPVEFGEHLVGQIERAIVEDVHLDTTKDADAADARCDCVDFSPLLAQARRVEPVGHREALRVVSQREIFKAGAASADRHLLDRGPPVGPRGMRMQVAAQISQSYQMQETLTSSKIPAISSFCIIPAWQRGASTIRVQTTGR